MKEMKIVKFDPHKHYSVDEWAFEWLLTLWFRWEEYRVHIDIKNSRVMALLKTSSKATNNQNITPPPPPDNGQYLCSMERQWMFKPID